MAFDRMLEPCAPIPLGEFFLEDRRFCAVYFLYYRGEVVYVGQSRTLKLRIDEHLAQRTKEFDAVAFIRCPFNRLTEVEARFIRELAPKHNNCRLTKRVREKDSWRLDRSRKGYRRSKFEGVPTDKIEFVDASQCHIEERDIGEFMQVSDKDAAAWVQAGKIRNTSIMGLFEFMARNHREVGAAQDRFSEL
jgi:hypothetical protein